MNIRDYNAFCRKLPATTHVVQWGGSHVWKVGGKVFAIAGDDDGRFSVTFKVSELAFEISEGPARLASRTLPRLARLHMDPAFRQAWPLGYGLA